MQLAPGPHSLPWCGRACATSRGTACNRPILVLLWGTARVAPELPPFNRCPTCADRRRSCAWNGHSRLNQYDMMRGGAAASRAFLDWLQPSPLECLYVAAARCFPPCCLKMRTIGRARHRSSGHWTCPARGSGPPSGFRPVMPGPSVPDHSTDMTSRTRRHFMPVPSAALPRWSVTGRRGGRRVRVDPLNGGFLMTRSTPS